MKGIAQLTIRTKKWKKFSNVELGCSKKPNFIKFTTVDVNVWKNIVQFTIKMEKIFKCGTRMFHLNLIMPWYKI